MTMLHNGLIGSISTRALASLHARRNESEYDAQFFAGENGAREAVKLAEEVVHEVREYYKNNGIEFFE